jgi:hypothetical protein
MSTELEALFSSAARVQILRLFLTNPGQKYYQREIERETGQPIRAVQREVKRLTDIDLLCRETKGNRVFHVVNRDFVLLSELTALFIKAGLIEESVSGSAIAVALPEPASEKQPFDWMESRPLASSPAALRCLQLDGEWDQAY